ncbi:MAG TPA: cytochrome c oxidase subunit II [Pyrinomonadaceae bacterium]|nr:cytochrome c oxidase subunit II [Pyrinomonadaceae bacterium]
MGRALAVIIWILTFLSVFIFACKKWWLPPSISEHGPALDRQFMITIVIVGLAFSAAQIGLGYMLWKYRDTSNGSRATYSHGSNKLEVLWTVITAIIFIGLGVMGQSVWASLRLNDAPAGSNQIEVVAQQFQWNFHYSGKDKLFGRTDPKFIDDSGLNFVGLDESDPNAKDDSVTTALAIPVNRPTELILRSKDVIHSFWVPPLRFKQDLVPGMAIRVHFTPNRVGKYELACAELCGQLHFKMKSYMLVLPEEEYRALSALSQEQFQAKMKELLDRYPLPETN